MVCYSLTFKWREKLRKETMLSPLLQSLIAKHVVWFFSCLFRHPNLVFGYSNERVTAWSGHFCLKRCEAVLWRLLPTVWCTAPVIKLNQQVMFSSQAWMNISMFHTLLSGCILVLCLDGKGFDSKRNVSSVSSSAWSSAELGPAVLWASWALADLSETPSF